MIQKNNKIKSNKKYYLLILVLLILLYLPTAGKTENIFDGIEIIVPQLPVEITYNPKNIYLGSLVFIYVQPKKSSNYTNIDSIILIEKLINNYESKKSNIIHLKKIAQGVNLWFETYKIYTIPGIYQHTFKIIYKGPGKNTESQNFSLSSFTISEKIDPILDDFLNKAIELSPFHYSSEKIITGYQDIFKYIQMHKNDWDVNFIKISKLTNIKIKIIGHSDRSGSSNRNIKLSLKRAKSVMGTIIQNYKINENRFIIEGKGSLQKKYTDLPGLPSQTVNSNRRVEILFLTDIK